MIKGITFLIIGVFFISISFYIKKYRKVNWAYNIFCLRSGEKFKNRDKVKSEENLIHHITKVARDFGIIFLVGGILFLIFDIPDEYTLILVVIAIIYNFYEIFFSRDEMIM